MSLPEKPAKFDRAADALRIVRAAVSEDAPKGKELAAVVRSVEGRVRLERLLTGRVTNELLEEYAAALRDYADHHEAVIAEVMWETQEKEVQDRADAVATAQAQAKFLEGRLKTALDELQVAKDRVWELTRPKLRAKKTPVCR